MVISGMLKLQAFITISSHFWLPTFTLSCLHFVVVHFTLTYSDLSSLVDCALLEDRTLCITHLLIPSALISMVSIG